MGEGETWTPHTGRVHTPMANLQRRLGLVRALQQPAVGGGRGRLRVRLQHRGPRGARALGGPVRRLRQRRPDHDRPVHRLGARQVGRGLAAHAAAAARLRGQRPRALLGPHRALPPARRRGQHPGGELQHRRQLLPPAAQAGAHRPPAAADHLHAQEPAARPQRLVAAGGPDRRAASSRSTTTRARPATATGVTRLILCSGKVFHELDGHADREAHPELAIGRAGDALPLPRGARRRAAGLVPRATSR